MERYEFEVAFEAYKYLPIHIDVTSQKYNLTLLLYQ